PNPANLREKIMSEELKSVIEQGLKGVQDQLQAKMSEYNAELAKSTGQVKTELTGEIEKLAEQYKGLKEQMIDLAQKQTPASTEGKSETAGMEFVSSEAFKSLVSGQREKVRLEVKNT